MKETRKYIIVRVSEGLHRKVRVKAAFEDITISDVVRGFLKAWLRENPKSVDKTLSH